MKSAAIALAALSVLAVNSESVEKPGLRQLDGHVYVKHKSKSAKDYKAKSAKSGKLFKSAKKGYGPSHSGDAAAGAAAACGGITEEQIEAAQAAWGEGIVTIGEIYNEGGHYLTAATDHINTLYAYGMTPVLFKPTLAAENQFRSDFAGALSYFVADGYYAEDLGFAIKGWTSVRFENVDILTNGPVGQAMGNYYFGDPDSGEEVKVEYSFGYILDDDCNVRINLHHSSLPYGTPAPEDTITEEQIEAAQKAWGEGIIRIGEAYNNGEDYAAFASDHINTLYAYETPPILFKPTLAAENQFRSTFEGALSYFIADGYYDEDLGFAIKGWTDVRFENDDIITNGDVGMAMGNYYFTDPDSGEEVKVEYSFGYMLDENGDVRIHLHHSSLPYDSTVEPDRA